MPISRSPKQREKQIKALKSYKPGEERAKINGRKGGKAPRSRSIKEILKTYLELGPDEILPLPEKEKKIAEALKHAEFRTTKDLIWWKLIEKAKMGDMNAMKMVADHIGEDPGMLLKIGGHAELPPIQVDTLSTMSIEQLEGLQGLIEKEMNQDASN